MISPSLYKAFLEEQTIFQHFGKNSRLGNFNFFYSPGANQIPHWNLIYPLDSSNPLPNQNEAIQLNDFYKMNLLDGHILVTDPKFRDTASEESEYFKLENFVIRSSDSAIEEMTHRENDLEGFCNLIQIAFSLNDITTAYFKEKMSILKQNVNSRFYIISVKSRIVGGCSVFQTSSGASFIFNVATLPEMQGKGIAKDIIGYAANRSPKPVYIYSHNSIMRESILPKMGFCSLGTMWCVPIQSFLGVVDG